MLLNCESLSSPGPVRTTNEDNLLFWQPEDDEDRLRRGAIAIMADGVGGHAHGELASRIAIDSALELFKRMNPANPPRQVLRQIIEKANLAVYEAGMEKRDGGATAT